MRDLAARLIADQKIRFLLFGGINTVMGYSVYSALTLWVFHEVRFGYVLSLLCAYAVSIVVAFLLYRRFVFVVVGNVVQDFLRFVVVNLAAISTNLALLPTLVELGGLPPLVAQALVLLVTTLGSFFGHRMFSFRRDQPV